jgi:hypothetical protein
MSRIKSLHEQRERLLQASLNVGKLIIDTPQNTPNYYRLIGKQQGVELALSYLEEEIRQS